MKAAGKRSKPDRETFPVYHRPDYEREGRQGFPEAVLCCFKSPEQVLGIALAHERRRRRVLFTRLDKRLARRLRRRLGPKFRYHPIARMGELRPLPLERTGFSGVLVVTAGTSDVPVAEEAALTAEHILGRRVERIYDVGVAGIHRLLERASSLERARCIVVCAGMEGALASVVGGLAPCPVIGVPTSVGYGVAADGRTALHTMLASCASNVCVVNIDNGFSAGVLAALIAKQGLRGR